RTLSKTQNNHLTGKAPYKFESIFRSPNRDVGGGRIRNRWSGARLAKSAAASLVLTYPAAPLFFLRIWHSRRLSCPSYGDRGFEPRSLQAVSQVRTAIGPPELPSAP